MDKMKLAHEHMMAMISAGCHDGMELLLRAWEYADAMQAEADKRKPSGLPDALCEVDWSVAPQDTAGWKIKESRAYWIDSDGWIIEEAPSFGFTGTHIVERPE